MATQELGREPLGMIARQIQTNRLKGDMFSYDGKEWIAYGAGITSYEYSFQGVLDGRRIQDLLKDKEDLVVIDLMAPSGTLVGLFRQLPSKKKFGLAVTLEDLRDDSEEERDAKLNIIQISADILKPSSWKRIEEQLQGRKADLIMERAVCGLDCCIPQDPRLYAALSNKSWGLMKEDGGILLAQFPGVYDILVWETISALKDNKSMLSLKDSHDNCYLRLVKTPNSPEKLPFPAMR